MVIEETKEKKKKVQSNFKLFLCSPFCCGLSTTKKKEGEGGEKKGGKCFKGFTLLSQKGGLRLRASIQKKEGKKESEGGRRRVSCTNLAPVDHSGLRRTQGKQVWVIQRGEEKEKKKGRGKYIG